MTMQHNLMKNSSNVISWYVEDLANISYHLLREAQTFIPAISYTPVCCTTHWQVVRLHVNHLVDYINSQKIIMRWNRNFVISIVYSNRLARVEIVCTVPLWWDPMWHRAIDSITNFDIYKETVNAEVASVVIILQSHLITFLRRYSF